MLNNEKQDAYLNLLGKMIGTLTIEPSKINHMGAGAPKGTQADAFNELMDAAIAKAHKAMEESMRYADDQFALSRTIQILGAKIKQATGEERNRLIDLYDELNAIRNSMGA